MFNDAGGGDDGLIAGRRAGDVAWAQFLLHLIARERTNPPCDPLRRARMEIWDGD
jgi:hypothetical protein